MARASLRTSIATGLLALTLIVSASVSTFAQGSIDPDDAEEAWVIAAVAYCNSLAFKKPWMVPYDPTCQELLAMGLIAAGRFILPSKVE